MSEQRIKRNAVRCLDCLDVIESRHRHNFVACSCSKNGYTNTVTFYVHRDAGLCIGDHVTLEVAEA